MGHLARAGRVDLLHVLPGGEDLSSCGGDGGAAGVQLRRRRRVGRSGIRRGLHRRHDGLHDRAVAPGDAEAPVGDLDDPARRGDGILQLEGLLLRLALPARLTVQVDADHDCVVEDVRRRQDGCDDPECFHCAVPVLVPFISFPSGNIHRNLPTRAFRGRFPGSKLGKQGERRKESGGFGRDWARNRGELAGMVL